MKTTIDIPDELMAEALSLGGYRTKREAVVAGLQELVRRKLRAELAAMVGNYDYGMTNDELEAAFPDD